MSTNNDNQIKFRATPELLEHLEARTEPGGSIGLTARRDLELFYKVMEAEREKLGFTEKQQDAIAPCAQSLAPFLTAGFEHLVHLLALVYAVETYHHG